MGSGSAVCKHQYGYIIQVKLKGQLTVVGLLFTDDQIGLTAVPSGSKCDIIIIIIIRLTSDLVTT